MKNLTIGILAHVDAGKTTLTEALLYETGQIRSLGRVDHKDAFLDTNALERERGITIFSKQARIETPHSTITILDTPGHVDFSAETERTLQVLDYAILVISGMSGVQSHTRTLWRLLKHYHVPVLLFVNKMDMAGADHDATLAQLKSDLSDECVDFSSIRSSALGNEPLPEDTLFSEESGDDPDWLEEVSFGSEAMMNQLLEMGSIPLSMIQNAVSDRHLFPVFFGSALKLEETAHFFNGLCTFTKEGDYPSSFAARVYKIGRDTQGNRLTYLKLTGGSLKVRTPISSSVGDDSFEEKVTEIRRYSGEKYDTADTVRAGEVCAVTGLTRTRPGMGLGEEPSGELPLLEPVLNYSLILPSTVNPADFYRKVKQLEEEDPELHLTWDDDAKEIHAQMMGQVQIEILIRLIAERFGVAVEFGPGKIVYKETIAAPVEGVGHFEPLRHYAEAHLLLEPGERGSGIQVASACSEDALDLHWQRLILTHVLEREHRGVLTGSHLTDVRITLLSGRAHVKHTEGGDFRQATYRAIRQGLKSTESVLLEPFYSFTLDIPEDTVGRALTDLADRFGKPSAPEFYESAGRHMARITGTVPVATMNDYITDVHSYTRGEGSLTLTLSGYDICHNPEEVIRAAKYDSEMDFRNPTGSVFCAHGSGFNVPWNQVPEYMHLPYTFVPKNLEDVYLENEYADSFSAENGWGKGAPSRRAGASLDEAEELEAIYQREFGRSSEQAIREDQRREAKNRAKSEGTLKQKVNKKGQPIYPKKDQREEYLIVDGYNIIFSWPELSKLKDVNIDAARDQLLEIISNYQGYTGRKISVVFDAYKVNRTPQTFMTYDHLEVVFTQRDETADAYIERTVHELTDKYHITVATSDALEQLTVMRLGALRMSAGMLAEEVQRVTGRTEF